jgi:hypothetical protein
MDRDSVGGAGPGAGALGRSGAPMNDAGAVSDVGAVLLIFVMLAVALAVQRRRRKNVSSQPPTDSHNQLQK